jgi:hypothetical protein
VVAILLGWWLLQETPHGTEWVGMVIVLVSVAAVIASRPPAGKAVAELEGPIQEISRMDQSSENKIAVRGAVAASGDNRRLNHVRRSILRN